MSNATQIQTEQESIDSYSIDMSMIHRSKNINPRRSRNTEDFKKLCDSVKRLGVFQPILLRPSNEQEGMYEVVAGDSRFVANERAGHPSILAVVRDLSDEEAKELAALENLDRSNLSPVEEAWIASDMMTLRNQDAEEVAKVLGWSQAKLKQRLLISHCSDEVSEALTERKIDVGHAEVLAPLTEKQQSIVLGRIIESKMTVKETRNRLREINPVLKHACFDTSDCKACRHNSASNADLLATSDDIENATCYHAPCWETKTQAALNIIVTDARENYGKAFFDTEVSSEGHTFLQDSGEQGIGAQQISACQSCEHFGAIIQTGYKKQGKVIPGACFNMTCHAEKVASYQETLKAIDPSNTSNLNEQTSDTSGSCGQAASQSKATASTKKAGKKKSDAPSALRKSVKRLAFDRFGEAAQYTIKQNTIIALAMSALTLIDKVSRECTSKEARQSLDGVCKKYCGTSNVVNSRLSHHVVSGMVDLGAETISALIVEVASLLAYRDDQDTHEKSDAGKFNLALIDQYQTNTAAFEVVNEKYLDAQTKGVILNDCTASGFKEDYDQAHGEGSFADLAKKPAKEFKKAILEHGFDWLGYEPYGFKLTDYQTGTQQSS